jgi:hypothetical protein
MSFRIFPFFAPTLLALAITSPAAAQIATGIQLNDSPSKRSTRVQQTRVEVNGRTIETQALEAPATNGGYALEFATEKQTFHDDLNTTREVERWYAPDGDGRPQLSRSVETHITTIAGKTTRVRYDTDLNGHLQEQQREKQETISLNDSTKQITSTLFLLRGGVFRPAQQTVTVEERKEGGLTDVQRTIFFADENGTFIESQVTRTVEERDSNGSGRRTLKSVSKADFGKVLGEGQMSSIQRTDTQEWNDPGGQQHSLAETHSRFTPGLAEDGQLHLNQQVATVRNIMPDGSWRVFRETSEINPGARTDAPQPRAKVIEISRRDSGDQFETHTIIEAPDSLVANQAFCTGRTQRFATQNPTTPLSTDAAEDDLCR